MSFTHWVNDPENNYSVLVRIWSKEVRDDEVGLLEGHVTDFDVVDKTEATDESLDWLTLEYLNDYQF